MTPKPKATRKELTEALAAIPAGARVFVCGHTRADGDAIASVLALVRAFELRGVEARAVLADNATPPAPYLWMPGCENFLQPKEITASADVFIALDTPDFKRLNEAGELLRQAKQSIIIDHHPPLAESYADIRYTRPESAATGELVWSLLGDLGWQRDEIIASACYVATLSDTGSFQFSNTNDETFAYASEMIHAGAQPARIAQLLYGQKPLAALHLEGRILSRAKALNGGAVIHSYLSDADLQELGVPVDYTENLIDLIRCERDSKIALFITQSSKGPRLSLRSDGSFDVSEAAKRFGGGGHKPAAGITWPDKAASLEQILDEILPYLPQYESELDLSTVEQAEARPSDIEKEKSLEV
jgi:phosphoesterase RecJ-like protein